MDIDVSLDDVIAKKRSKAGRGRGRARGGARGGARSASDRSNVREKYSGSVPAQTGTAKGAKSPLAGLPGDGSKIVVSNLPDDVSENQIKELFDSTVGRVKRINLSYRSDGKSSGVATIEFNKAGDGAKAFAAYNGRLIDQKRPMKVEIIVDPSRIPPPPLSSRVTPAKVEETTANAQASTSTGETGGRRGGRARGRGRRGRGKESRPAVTAEQLDQEMEAYTKGEEATA